MQRWRQAALLGRLLLWAAMFWLILDGLPHIANWRQRPAPAPPPPESFSLSLTISPASIRAGQTATLCYEVRRAASFTIDPAPPGFTGATRACLPVSPAESTRFTLTATDPLSNRLSKSFPLAVTR